MKEAGFKDVKVLNEQLYMDSDNTNERKITSLDRARNRITMFFKREPEKTVLFVFCVENAGRSQIAEG